MPQETVENRKIFFLNPDSVIQEELIDAVSQADYEAYLITDHLKATKLLARFPGSILFVNIDKRIRNLQWATYIKEFMSDPQTHTVRIGVLSYNADPDLTRRYLIDLSVPCGFVHLKPGIVESTRFLIQVLEANDARGKRKFVRAVIPADTSVTFNVKNHNSFITGRISDISVAAMACYFDQDPGISIGQTVNDMQLNLRGNVVGLSGVIVGHRHTAMGKLYVVAFTLNQPVEVRQKIRSFVYSTLHREMNRLISSL